MMKRYALFAAMVATGSTLIAQTPPAPAPSSTAPSSTAPAGPGTTAAAPGSATAAPGTPQAAPASGTAAATPIGTEMVATQTIAANIALVPDLSTLTTAIRAAGLDQTLAGPGPFTVFAPTNAAFGRLAPGTLDTLMKPANKATLTKVLSYHVVPGTITIADIKARTAAGGGKLTLTTVAGDPLTITAMDGAIELTDVSGNKSYVQTGDVRQANGIVHIVNGVVVPKLQ